MRDARLRAPGAEREMDLRRSVVAKRPRNDSEYEYYTRDRSLSSAYFQRREDLRLAEARRDREGVDLLDDRVRAPFLDDRRCVSQSGLLPFSNGLKDNQGLNVRSDSDRIDPLIGTTQSVDDVQYLPEDASNTLFVVGVPSDCTSREAAHIFRPFRGFKEVRVVKKLQESKKSHGGGEREASSAVVVLCFVEFDNPKCAAIAMESLQGYKFDENDRDSPSLKLQFSFSSNARNRNQSGSSFGHDRDRDSDYYHHR